MNVLDTSIANVAIPTISGNLGVSVDEGTWVITVFAAANAVSIPLTGWLTQRIGQVKLFVGAILMNVVMSELIILVVCFFALLVLGADYDDVLKVLFAVAILFPILFFHHSWSLWLAFDYLIESLPKYEK